MTLYNASPLVVNRSLIPNIFDVLALGLVIGGIILLVYGIHETTLPKTLVDLTPVSLDWWRLPEYALRTTLRMLAAVIFSLLFTFIYATLAAKNRYAKIVLIPILDILQSVPILGFLTFTVIFFMNLYPGRVLGAELAAIFAIFTSQTWNMTFSFYQSLCNIPKDLEEVSHSFRLSNWQRFWKLDVPFSMPGLVWNTMMSMSGSWFFVVASETITVNDSVITLPGIGSYVGLAIKDQNLPAVGYALLTMLLVIIFYDQLLFRPIVAWADKFRFEQTVSASSPNSWVLDLFRRTKALRIVIDSFEKIFSVIGDFFQKISFLPNKVYYHSPEFLKVSRYNQQIYRVMGILWISFVFFIALYISWKAFEYLHTTLRYNDVLNAINLGLITLLRVAFLVVIATLIWVPIGTWIGLRPKISAKIQPLAQFLAAFPANIAFPPFVAFIVYYKLNPNIWLSSLMILGTQWYILFNVIAGASAFPNDLREVAKSFHVKGWRWWKNVIIPGIFPYYITGAITAFGGAWNASIVSEVVSWGDMKLSAKGLGAYIAKATEEGNIPETVLGIVVMCLFVLLFNRFLWRPLYIYSERHFRFD